MKILIFFLVLLSEIAHAAPTFVYTDPCEDGSIATNEYDCAKNLGQGGLISGAHSS